MDDDKIMLSLVPLMGTRESVLIQFLLVVFGGFNMSGTGIVIPVMSVRYYSGLTLTKNTVNLPYTWHYFIVIV